MSNQTQLLKATIGLTDSQAGNGAQSISIISES